MQEQIRSSHALELDRQHRLVCRMRAQPGNSSVHQHELARLQIVAVEKNWRAPHRETFGDRHEKKVIAVNDIERFPDEEPRKPRSRRESQSDNCLISVRIWPNGVAKKARKQKSAQRCAGIKARLAVELGRRFDVGPPNPRPFGNEAWIGADRDHRHMRAHRAIRLELTEN
ncbi:hypothetical protein [Methylosinus sporium]|uniref:hypothetical protein n=2 Tax=Methylosinus TaxID=425 RepID=UPI001FEFD8A1|nr:hypothetical protein [Methylosinus sporium]